MGRKSNTDSALQKRRRLRRIRRTPETRARKRNKNKAAAACVSMTEATRRRLSRRRHGVSQDWKSPKTLIKAKRVACGGMCPHLRRQSKATYTRGGVQSVALDRIPTIQRKWKI